MKLKHKTIREGFTQGKDYELFKSGWGHLCLVMSDDGHECSFDPEHFETVLERFERISSTANKIILIKPGTGVTVDLLMTENYFIVYSHTKGNHWNISGNHYKYWHDINTCEFISESILPGSAYKEPVLMKQRILKADYIRISKAYNDRINSSCSSRDTASVNETVVCQ